MSSRLSRKRGSDVRRGSDSASLTELPAALLPAIQLSIECNGGAWVQIIDDAEDTLMPLYEAGIEQVQRVRVSAEVRVKVLGQR